MPARATASATITFGLVSIPVKLFSSVDSTRSIRFNMLRADGARLKQQYVSVTDGEIVPRDDQVRGYEFAKGQFVLFTPEEIKAMEAKSTNMIEITEFIPASLVDRVYIEKTNYLGPDKGAARSYHLLKAAMDKTGRAALGKYNARGKCYLVLVSSKEDGLVLEQLRHADELRPFGDVPMEHSDVSDAELELAIQLIDQVSTEEFHPEHYEDEVKHHMMECIEKKVEGQDITVPPEEQPEAKIIDIMEALKASLDRKGKAAPKKQANAAPKKKATTKAAKKKASAGRSRAKS